MIYEGSCDTKDVRHRNKLQTTKYISCFFLQLVILLLKLFLIRQIILFNYLFNVNETVQNV